MTEFNVCHPIATKAGRMRGHCPSSSVEIVNDAHAITRAHRRDHCKSGKALAAKPKVLVLNGPNLNLLGAREPEIYGTETLDDIERQCRERADALGLAIEFRQSNTEGELVDWIQGARDGMAGIVINAGAYTHTSVAILDALQASDLPIVEVHLSNIFRRESFRHHSYVSQAATGLVCGFGGLGYSLALEAMAHLILDGQGGH